MTTAQQIRAENGWMTATETRAQLKSTCYTCRHRTALGNCAKLQVSTTAGASCPQHKAKSRS